MKRYIRCSVSKDIITKAVEFAEDFKGATIDLENHMITIPFASGVTEELVMEPGMLGDQFVQNGFDASFEINDVEYETKPEMNYRSMTRTKGHKAYLRNRLIGTFTW